MQDESNPELLDLDRLIDSALGTYAHADAGLEQRVLARVGTGPAPASRLPRILWAAALAAAACGVLLIFALMHAGLGRAPESNARKTPNVQPATEETARPKETARVKPLPVQRAGGPLRHEQPKNRAGGRPETRAVAGRLPKQEVFPTPRPLSLEERALVDFATQAPAAARDSFVAAQKEADAPIAIVAIHIDPIQIPPLELPQPGTN